MYLAHASCCHRSWHSSDKISTLTCNAGWSRRRRTSAVHSISGSDALLVIATTGARPVLVDSIPAVPVPRIIIEVLAAQLLMMSSAALYSAPKPLLLSSVVNVNAWNLVNAALTCDKLNPSLAKFLILERIIFYF